MHSWCATTSRSIHSLMLALQNTSMGVRPRRTGRAPAVRLASSETMPTTMGLTRASEISGVSRGQPNMLLACLAATHTFTRWRLLARLATRACWASLQFLDCSLTSTSAGLDRSGTDGRLALPISLPESFLPHQVRIPVSFLLLGLGEREGPSYLRARSHPAEF